MPQETKSYKSGESNYNLSMGYSYRPFSNQMRKSNHALIIQEEGSNGLKWIMLDEKNAARFKKLPSENITLPGRKNSSVKPYKIALYHLELDDFSKRSESKNYVLDFDVLRKQPQFLRLKVQMKFFNGAIHYSDEEIKILKSWIKEHGVDKMEEFFIKTILIEQDFNKRVYKESRLYKVFQTLKDEVSLLEAL